MSQQNDRGVPRGDHAPAEERGQNQEQRAEPGVDSAPERGHGAHGKGVLGREQRVDDVNVEPGDAEGGPRGNASWGGEPSGGSVIDKR
jgi:hypothetical protein